MSNENAATAATGMDLATATRILRSLSTHRDYRGDFDDRLCKLEDDWVQAKKALAGPEYQQRAEAVRIVTEHFRWTMRRDFPEPCEEYRLVCLRAASEQVAVMAPTEVRHTIAHYLEKSHPRQGEGGAA